MAVGVSPAAPLLVWGKTGLQSELRRVSETVVTRLGAVEVADRAPNLRVSAC